MVTSPLSCSDQVACCALSNAAKDMHDISIISGTFSLLHARMHIVAFRDMETSEFAQLRSRLEIESTGGAGASGLRVALKEKKEIKWVTRMDVARGLHVAVVSD